MDMMKQQIIDEVATVIINVEFFGKNAHSSRPERGINALSSVLTLFNNIGKR